MKTNIRNGIITFILVFGTPHILKAQGTTTFLSNLAQASAGSSAVGSDSWLAAGFQTGANSSGYLLSSVQLDMGGASGVPNGFTVMIYANIGSTGLTPGGNIGNLNGSSSPTGVGTYSYTPSSSLALSPNSIFFIVITSATQVGNGAFKWDYAGANNYNPNGGWFSLGGGWTSGNGTSWNAGAAVFSQFAINATAAPEPGTWGLIALGGLAFGLKRWNEKRRS